jgi:hypothetical protein
MSRLSRGKELLRQRLSSWTPMAKTISLDQSIRNPSP